MHPVSGSKHQISDISQQTPCICHESANTTHLASALKHNASGIRQQTPRTHHQSTNTTHSSLDSKGNLCVFRQRSLHIRHPTTRKVIYPPSDNEHTHPSSGKAALHSSSFNKQYSSAIRYQRLSIYYRTRHQTFSIRRQTPRIWHSTTNMYHIYGIRQQATHIGHRQQTPYIPH